MQPNTLRILRFRDAQERFARLRGKLLSWQSVRQSLGRGKSSKNRQKTLHQALALNQLLETLYAATDAFPVKVIDTNSDEDNDLNSLTVTAREDSEREALSETMNLKSPANRLEEVLKNDQRGGDWVLTESRVVGLREPNDTIWRFERRIAEPGKQVKYQFTGSNPPSNPDNSPRVTI